MPVAKYHDGTAWRPIPNMAGRTKAKLYDLIPALSPRSWWKLNETSGNFADSGPAGITGTAVTVPGRRITRGPDKYSHSIQSSINQGAALATFGDNYGFAGRLAYTFLIFYRPTAWGTNARRIMIKNDTTAGPFIGVGTTGYPFGGRYVSGAASMNGDYMMLNEWNMIALGYDGTNSWMWHNSGETWRQVDTGNMTASAGTNLRLNGELGNSSAWGADGNYSNFAVWDRALTAAELNALWECVV